MRQEASEHAFDVPVHHGVGLIEGDAQYGRGDVIPDSRKCPKILPAIGDAAGAVLDQHSGGAVQVARPGVIAQAFPKLENVLQVGAGQFAQGREALDKPPVVGQGRVDLGLLQHHFGNPDAVRVARLPPGQRPPVVLIPGEQPAAQAGNFNRCQHAIAGFGRADHGSIFHLN